MKIGILQAGHAPDTLRDAGDYGELFTRLLGGHGFDFDIYSVVDGDFPAGVDAADGWLITGSKHSAYEGLDWIAPLEDLVRRIKSDGRPMIGVCFGHQIIAQALGGKVEKFHKGWSVGPTEYHIEGQTLALNAWHQDQVVKVPDGAIVVGQSDFCDNAALLYGDQIWTIQPHPEFDTDFIEGLMKTRGKGVVPDELLDAAAARLDTSLHRKEIATFMAAFFKKARSQ